MRRNVLQRIVGVAALLATSAGLAACGSSEPVDLAPAQDEAAAAADTATAAPVAEPPEAGAEATEPTSTERSSPAASPEEATAIDTERFPTVVDAVATATGDPDDGTWRFDVTLSSPYDTPERYADAWRVLDPDDSELGIRVLTHDHANEQPFTRSTTVEIPAGVEQVFVEGRDQANGWSGERFEVTLDR